LIEANDLRIKGIKAIENEIREHGEATISYRGKAKYIVISCEEYEKLRVAELDALYMQARKDIERGEYEAIETLDDLEKHIASL